MESVFNIVPFCVWIVLIKFHVIIVWHNPFIIQHQMHANVKMDILVIV